MSERFYPDWLSGYVVHQRYSEAPLSFHFWAGVATVAGALRRRVWVDQLQFDWTPNMYVILVAPAGIATKSTTMRSGLSLLERVPGIKFGPKSMTWQALLLAMKRAVEHVKIEETDKPIAMSCLTIGVSELGTFLDPQNRELVDFLTDLWDSPRDPFRRETKGDGEIVIPRPWLNLIACTTPSWLKANFPEGLIGGGLTSRIIFVYANKKRQHVAYPSEQVQDREQFNSEDAALLHDLTRISQIQGPYRLTTDAIAWGDRWYKHHTNGGLPDHLKSARYDGYASRKQTHVHKLAIVLAAARRDERVITLSDLQDAERHITELEEDMIQVFDSIGVSEAAQVTDNILQLVQRHGVIESKTLWQMCMKQTDERAFVSSILAGVNAGYVTKEKLSDDNHKLTWTGPPP